MGYIVNWTAMLGGIAMPTNGQREFAGAILLIVGLLFYLGGAGYLSLWLISLPETWSKWIGKVLIVVGAALVISALGIVFE
ncbi:MAG: hypothetical protein QOF30_851 [Acidimicrobiaceae bacterium]|jgi:hypothetical protein|nr:hypothetical protein [Acidimicrobiaceae bacterium]